MEGQCLPARHSLGDGGADLTREVVASDDPTKRANARRVRNGTGRILSHCRSGLGAQHCATLARPMKKLLLFACLLSSGGLAPSFAAHPFFCTDSAGNKVAIVSAEGKIEWEFACKHPQDCWVLADGHLLFCHAA